MQRYFSDTIKNNLFTLSENDSYHIKKVMRMKIGDKIEIVCDKCLYICEIVSDINKIIAKIIENKQEFNELGVKVIVCQSLVNDKKMELVLQKCTELGAYAFYPYKATNSVIKDNGKGVKKVSRWQMIVKEASEQSKRNIIPKVYDFIDLNELMKIESSLKLLCTVNEVTKNVKSILQEHCKCDTIILVIGPEGGFHHLEEEKLINSGFISVSLGKRVLRSETAAITLLSMINYEWMV